MGLMLAKALENKKNVADALDCWYDSDDFNENKSKKYLIDNLNNANKDIIFISQSTLKYEYFE